MEKTDAQWKEVLTPEQFAVTRQGGTERAFSGIYYDHHEAGVYRCVCCKAELFSSEQKYDSGSGWPSFWNPIDSERVTVHHDTRGGLVRDEIRCAACDAHLGHVFPDGPPPSNTRYCVNSAALDFEKR